MVTIDKEALHAFDAPEGPVVMINLFRLKDRTEFGAFIQALRGISGQALDGAGAEIIYAGAIGGEFIVGERWDTVVLFRYPSWQAFRDLSADEETFEKTQAVRRQYLEDARFMVSTPLGG